jgi:hypothetical protein
MTLAMTVQCQIQCVGYRGECLPCRATTLKMKTTDKVMTTTGSTFRPGDSSVYSPRNVC